ncbi:hypothetical protein Hamer_G020062 [Homarus americanus]|uniref:Uncharacterized protein n=1 Tax=Homarus americanus TaxID=6706 RepID=A0A8J5JGK1_HOMAM|nr:hypothetical protein Hamer_G020062 [Homarus americanus]
MVFDRSLYDFSCPSAGSTPSASALSGYSYSQGWTTPLGYVQYNLTYFSRGPGRLDLLCYLGTIRP